LLTRRRVPGSSLNRPHPAVSSSWGRLTKAQFATYNGTAPLEASCGGRIRHRLNPRGNRTLNVAVHIAAVVQVRTRSEGLDDYEPKIAEPKTTKEAIRALKWRISESRLPTPHRRRRPHGRLTKGPAGQPATTLQSSVAGSNPEHRRFGQVTSRAPTQR
jgi:hypothetical protein